MRTLGRFVLACAIVGATEAVVGAAIRHHLETEQDLADTREQLAQTRDHLAKAHLKLLFMGVARDSEEAPVGIEVPKSDPEL